MSVKSSLAAILLAAPAFGAQNVIIQDVPDYSWYAGCFGTASGNLMGYWDRNGFPNFYTGPTNDGLAPLNSTPANVGIRSLWANRSGFDGRPADQPGHVDDYWTYLVDDDFYSYKSSDPDPYVLAGRPEHKADCLGDFMGSSQNKWADLDGECSGNVDAFSFNFWDKTGAKRVNFAPPEGVRDIQSGWRLWADSRGTEAETFSQLADFNPDTPAGTGFTFADLKAEIDAGYPVMLFLQDPGNFGQFYPHMANGNPEAHALIAYGYIILDDGSQIVRYRTSWASGDRSMSRWIETPFDSGHPVRGVIGFHPHPKITEVKQLSDAVSITWDGPSSNLQDTITGDVTAVHRYVIESSSTIDGDYQPVSYQTTSREMVVAHCCDGTKFFRVKLLPPPETQTP